VRPARSNQFGWVLACLPVTDEIRRLPDHEVDGEEGWHRPTTDPDVRGVEAVRHTASGNDLWHVVAYVAEFLRVDPLEDELSAGMIAALRAVPGVTSVEEEDREVWIVGGSPSGEALVRAAAGVVDGLAAQARAYIDGLD
jgi:hypothetical protein